jgi:hypothetical protein
MAALTICSRRACSMNDRGPVCALAITVPAPSCLTTRALSLPSAQSTTR